MSQNHTLKEQIRGSLTRDHGRALATDSYLFTLDEQVWQLAKKFGNLDLSSRRKIHREFGRISYLSKQNGYSTRQYLKLLGQLIEGIANESKSETDT